MGAGLSSYDGLADWYDEHLAAFTLQATDVIRRFVGRGSGRCLDLGCGTGLHLPTLVELGWNVTGVDISADQLSRAKARVGDRAELVEADATDLPFSSSTFDAVLNAFTHTDVDDFGATLHEAARVMRPRGSLTFLGLHPCFVGPHARSVESGDVPELHAGYREQGRYTEAPGISPTGLRAAVGAVHLPLGALLGAFIGAGFAFEDVEEVGDGSYPQVLAIRAHL